MSISLDIEATFQRLLYQYLTNRIPEARVAVHAGTSIDDTTYPLVVISVDSVEPHEDEVSPYQAASLSLSVVSYVLPRTNTADHRKLCSAALDTLAVIIDDIKQQPIDGWKCVGLRAFSDGGYEYEDNMLTSTYQATIICGRTSIRP